MTARIIKAILSKKHKEFVASIKDEKVRKMVDENSIITGGAIVSMLLKESVSDFDYYFTDFETVKAVTKYYIDEFNRLHKDRPRNTAKPYMEIEGDRIRIRIQSAGIVGENTKESQYQYFESRPIEEGEEYRPVFLTDNAITLSNKIQIVIRFHGSVEEIHENYDFVHCTNHWTPRDKKLVLQPRALESIITKQLHYVGSKYPVCSFIRTRKFLKKGWHINVGQMLKICLQISELDLKDIKVLEDQLTGVDTAYFIQVLNYLKEKQAKDENFHVEMPYLISIIDKIF